MNKLTTIIATSIIAMLSFASTASSIEYKVGLTGQSAAYYGNVKETLKDSGKTSEDEAVAAFSYMSGFAEVSLESMMGLTLGVEYTPDVMDFASTDRVIATAALAAGGANTAVYGEDSGTQVINANVEDMMTAYVALPIMGTGLHVKVGYSTATLVTSETLATGSTYKDEDLDGMTVGVYFDGEIGDMAFYRVEGAYNEFDDIRATGTSGDSGGTAGSQNVITAELGGVSAKLSLGLKF